MCNCGGAKYKPPVMPAVIPAVQQVVSTIPGQGSTTPLPQSPIENPSPVAVNNSVGPQRITGYVIPPNGGAGGVQNDPLPRG